MKKKIISVMLSLALLTSGVGVAFAEKKVVNSRTINFEDTLTSAGVTASEDISAMIETTGENSYLTLKASGDSKTVIFKPSKDGTDEILKGGRYITVKFNITRTAAYGCNMVFQPVFVNAKGEEITAETIKCSANISSIIPYGVDDDTNRIMESLQKDTAHTMVYVVDTTENTYQILLDGKNLKTTGMETNDFSLPEAANGIGGISGVKFAGGGSKGYRIDNIEMSVWNEEEATNPDPNPNPDPEPGTDPNPNPGTNPEPQPESKELVFSYDFEKDTIGKVPTIDGLIAKVNSTSVKPDDYFSVVKSEGSNGSESKMLKITQEKAGNFTEYNRLVIPTGDIEGELIEVSYDVKLENVPAHVGAAHGILDYEYVDDVKTSHLQWGKGTFAFGRYEQRWYINDGDGKAPQWDALTGTWTNVKYIINTVKNTMTLYHDGAEVSSGVDVPLPKFDSKPRSIDGISGIEISVSKDQAQKQDFNAYFDNIKVYKREPLNFKAQNSDTDQPINNLVLNFKANTAFNDVGKVAIADIDGKVIDSSLYQTKADGDTLTVTLKTVLENKKDYVVTISGYTRTDGIMMSKPYEFTFTTEPVAYDVTYKVTEKTSGDTVESLSGLGGKTLNVTAINRNYNTNDKISFISFVTLIDASNKLVLTKAIDTGKLSKGNKSEQSIELEIPNVDLTGCRLKVMTWDSTANGNIIFDNLEIK